MAAIITVVVLLNGLRACGLCKPLPGSSSAISVILSVYVLWVLMAKYAD